LHNVLPDPQPSESADLTLSDQEVEQREQQQRALNLQARENIAAAQTKQQEDYQRRRAHAPKVLQLQPGEWVMERLEGANGKLSQQADGPFRFLRYTDAAKAVCLLEDSEGRSWRSSAQRVRRFVPRKPTAPAAPTDAGTSAAAAAAAAAATEAAAPSAAARTRGNTPPWDPIEVLTSSGGTPPRGAAAVAPAPLQAGAARQKRRRRPSAKQQQLQEEEQLKAAFLEAAAEPLGDEEEEKERPRKKQTKGVSRSRRQPLALDLTDPTDLL